MKSIDADRIVEAVAKMHRPEVRLNPADVGRLFNALTPKYETAEERERSEMLAGLARQSPLASVPIIGDATVAEGQMWVIETAQDWQPLVQPEFKPDPIAPEVLAYRDWMRDLYGPHTLGMPESSLGSDSGDKKP